VVHEGISDGGIDLRFVSSFLIALAALASAIPAGAAGVRDGSHDMDFAVGNWTTEVTIIKDPFNAPGQEVHMRGTKVARPVWNGKAVLEEIEAGEGTSHWQGATLFLYDPKAGQWSQNYADADEGRMDGTPSIGILFAGIRRRPRNARARNLENNLARPAYL
jgi:hypothetical protein